MIFSKMVMTSYGLGTSGSWVGVNLRNLALIQIRKTVAGVGDPGRS
jgi:hypothetical protein